MKTFDGYSKEKFSDTSVLLAGGGSKELSNFIGTLNWDSTNRKLQYKKIGDTNWSDLVTFGSNALNSTAYLPLAGGTMTGDLTVTGINFLDTDGSKPVLKIGSPNIDTTIWRVYSNNWTYGLNSSIYGYSLKYLGTGSGNDNKLVLIADNLTGARVTAVSITQDGNCNVKNTTISGTCDIRYLTSASGNPVFKILNYPSNYYGLITRIYGTGTVSLQALRETTTSEYFSLSLNPLGGNVGIGTTSPSYNLTVIGTLGVTGVSTFLSLIKSSVATGTSPFSITSTTMVNNLKSEMASSLSDWAESRITDANLFFGDGKVRKFIASSSMTAHKPTQDGTILHFAWDNQLGYDAQLAIANNSISAINTRLQWRAQDNGIWGEWKSVAFTDSNVASANKWATPRTLTLTGSVTGSVSIDGSGDVSLATTTNHTHNKIQGPDARNSNNTPLWYMSNRGPASVTSEFSSQGTSILGGLFTNLTTFTPWGDNTGNYPVQLAFNSTGMAMRTSASTDAWNGWPSGNIYAGNFYTASDIRYKKILSNIKVSVKQLAKIPLFNFTWTDVNDNMIHSGTSALKVKKFLPHIVTGSDKLTLDYATLGTIAGITACKELVNLKSEIDLLKERIKELEQQLKIINNN